MHFNPDKSFVMRLILARNVKYFHYTLGNTTLQETDSHSYLGVCITKNLNWNKHTFDYSLCKPHPSIHQMQSPLVSCPINIKTTAYTTLVRPLLEYSSSVWDPHTQIRINQIEMVQRLNDYSLYT